MNKTHLQKTLYWLRTYADKGINEYMLSKLVGTNYVPRRILDLRKAGYNIESKPETVDGSKTVRYILHEIKQLPKKLVFDDKTRTFTYATGI